MTATIDPRALRAALKTVETALTKPTKAVPFLPREQFVLIEIGDGRLNLSGGGRRCWIRSSIALDGDHTPAAVFLDPDLLVDYLADLNSDAVQIDALYDQLRITSGRDDAAFRGVDIVEHYLAGPELPRNQLLDPSPFQFDAQRLRGLIDQVVSAASRDDSRPSLACVLTRFDGDQITVAAADGFRMSIVDEPADNPVRDHPMFEGRLDFLTPARQLRDLLRFIGDRDGELTVAVSTCDKLLRVDLGESAFITRLYDGAYPDIRTIVPSGQIGELVVNREALTRAVKRASSFAGPDGCVRIAITPPVGLALTAGEMVVSPATPVKGSAESTIDLDRLDCPGALDIAFETRLLLGVLSSTDAETVTFALNGPRTAMVIRPTGQPNVTHIVMPLLKKPERHAEAA